MAGGTSMKPEQQRIAIAEVCGWKLCTPNRSWPNPYWTNPITKELSVFEQLPNYLNDLNAMHEAEKVLTDEQRWQQACFIVDYHQASGAFPLFSRSEVIALASAAAAQRAEAFLRTLNLWTE